MSPGSPCAEMADSVTRHAHQDIAPGEQARVTKHLQECSACRDFADFIEGFVDAGKQREAQAPAGPCAETSLIVALEADELDKEAMQRVFAHVVRCDACRNEYLLLRSMSGAIAKEHVGAEPMPLEEQITARIKAVLSEFGNRIIDIAKRYDPGTVLGGARILTEAPAFAFRGVAASSIVSKLFEISIGGLTYTVAVGMNSDRSIWCSVGSTAGQEHMLKICMYSADGKELLSSKTDKNGNGYFTLPRPEREFIVMRFRNASAEEWVAVKIPVI